MCVRVRVFVSVRTVGSLPLKSPSLILRGTHSDTTYSIEVCGGCVLKDSAHGADHTKYTSRTVKV